MWSRQWSEKKALSYKLLAFRWLVMAEIDEKRSPSGQENNESIKDLSS